jgi:beta-lactamase regulating signal transducer with metallopeptidase domain
MVLFKWTCLLALAWMIHFVLRRQHARWRLILWRGALCFGVILPLLQFFPVPRLKIPIRGEVDSTTEVVSSISRAAAVNPIPPASTVVQPAPTKTAVSPAPLNADSHQTKPRPAAVSWNGVLVMIWALGFFCGIVRLVRLQVQLFRLRQETREPAPDIRRLAKQIQVQLNVPSVHVQISEAASSPFICGLLKPMILLPQSLVEQLSPGEVSALLTHEIAHLRQHDLLWCVAWRWMKAVCWFHPLVWHVPAAHNLACEQEADRIASGQLADQDLYPRMLARIALRVLALPAVETRLTLNGSSQIARRLNHLGQRRGNWNWKYSVAAFALTGLLFLMTAGCEFSESRAADSKVSTPLEFKKVLVVVQDEDGKPIEGATVLPDGFRVKGVRRLSAYGWNKELFGPPEKAVTDREGKAYVKYPVEGIPEEKEFTGALIFSVTHPEFATVRPQEYSVNKPEQPIRLTRGIPLEVSGYFGNDQRPVTDLVPSLNQDLIWIRPEDWQKGDNGVYAFHKMSPGGHLIRLMGRLPSGEIVFSDSFTFTAEVGKKYNFALEMKPGIRLEGRLDDRVPRPVKNGRVLISVRPKEFPAWTNHADVVDIFKKYPTVNFWTSYRPIAEDGTFVFESIPPGGLDVIVHGDGFVSQNGGDFSQRVGSKFEKIPGFAVPQAFPLVTPTTKIEVLTEPTSTLQLTAKTKSGKPVKGATVCVSPNVIRMGGIFGNVRHSSEEPFRTLAPLPDIPYCATTDENGVAAIRNVPAADHRWIDVYHPQFQVPLRDPKGDRDRGILASSAPGTTNEIKVVLEPKGKDYIGSN